MSAEHVRIWKQRKIAEGYCAHCFKRKTGGISGTLRLCGKCARKHRVRMRRLSMGIKNLGWRKRRNTQATKRRISQGMKRLWAKRKGQTA